MFRRNLATGIAFLTLLSVTAGGAKSAHAQMSSGACGTENLLAGRMPSARTDTRGDLRLATDGQAAPEGAQWDAPGVGVFLDTPAGTITYDLGEVRPVGSFLLQADANDSYKVFGAEVDQPSAYKILVEIESVVNVGHGLRTRTVTIGATPIRYLRIGEPLGDSAYSISEFQAYCRAPTPFPPKLPTVNAPAATVVTAPWWEFRWFDNDASSRFEMGLALFALLLLGWGLWLDQRGTPNRHRIIRDRLLMFVGAVSFLCYFNFGLWHFRNYVHQWDTFHYYAGSKYFKEMSYDRLYECVAVADSEAPGLRRRVELRKIMNLRTNILGNTAEILAHPENCKKHFTPERWEAFKADVAHFRAKHDVKRWEELQTDHGYNATPVWNIVGTTLSNMGKASDDQIDFLTKIDPLFIAAITLMTWWAFGWRTMCVALAVFATNFPSRFYWTGGAFLRWDWLFYFVGGICLIKKERFTLGGFFLGYSTLLRVFPMFTFSGPILVLIRQLWGERSPDRPWWKPQPLEAAGSLRDKGRDLIKRMDRRYLSVLGGAAIAVAVLMPISLVTSSGIDGYKAFVFNTRKHKETPLTNYMGLRTVVSYSPSEAGRVLRNDRLEDPWGAWKKQKLITFKERAPLFLLFVAGFVVLLFTALRNNPDPWVACSMGAMMMGIGVELTCYYYSFLFAVAFLFHKRHEAGAILLGATAITGFIDWAPTKYLPNTGIWANLKMSQWLDEQYMWMSVFTLAAFIWILYRFGYLDTPERGEPELAAEAPSTAAKNAPSASRVHGKPSGRRHNRGGKKR
jgi:hypothetical protein